MKSRRQFLQQSAILTALSGMSYAESAPVSLKERIFKTLKFNMVGGESVLEKFKNAKAAGFQGIELNVPGAPLKEVLSAVKETGIIIDGSVCNTHWKIRHSDPDPAIRAQALDHLRLSLIETNKTGGRTVLLVPGHGRDGTYEEVWERSIENIRKALPLAGQLGVTIAIENVWNHFLYNHKGGSEQSAEPFVKYIDAFQSPLVGMQFDIGNHWKYGSTAQWIRDLGKRIVKLDLKGFSRAEGKFVDIGAGDIPFTEVRQALIDIHYHGWCAAEVAGGDLTRLKTVSAQMDETLALK